MSISFVVDSACDYLGQEVEMDVRTPVHVVPLNVNFEGEDTYLDGMTITHEEFYDKMRDSATLPKTSQPSPQRFYDMFERLLSEDQIVIYYGIASDLSGTYQSANVAKEMLPEADQDRVFLIDTGTVSGGVLYLLKYADDLRQKGCMADEIVEQIEEQKKHVTGIILLETLENLIKGGRISALQGRIAGILNIKPLLKVRHGKIETLEKFRGKKRGVARLAEMIHEWKAEQDELWIVHSYPSKQAVIDAFAEQFSLDSFNKTRFIKLGSVIGTYASEKAIGIIKY